jgi:hypothetical protein
MSLEFDPLSLHMTLRPVSTSGDAAAPVRTFILLPTLAELLGEPGFGHADPIVLPGYPRPLAGWALFGSARERGFVLH